MTHLLICLKKSLLYLCAQIVALGQQAALLVCTAPVTECRHFPECLRADPCGQAYAGAKHRECQNCLHDVVLHKAALCSKLGSSDQSGWDEPAKQNGTGL